MKVLLYILLDWRFWWTVILLSLVGLIVFGVVATVYGAIQRWRRKANQERSTRLLSESSSRNQRQDMVNQEEYANHGVGFADPRGTACR